jgi:protein-tyrosine-phosphatase
MSDQITKVLLLRAGNWARSILAEAILKRAGGQRRSEDAGRARKSEAS